MSTTRPLEKRSFSPSTGRPSHCDGGNAIVPSTVKVASAGTRIDIPLHHAHAAYVRTHFDAIEVCVPDGPRPDEIVFIVALAIGGRPHPRVGGLRADEIKLGDGQR